MTAEVRQFECNESEARTLTEDIRRAGDKMLSLLSRAYEWKAWRALGYVSFTDYVGAEFGIGKSHAYRLLDQSRVIAAIEAVADSPIGESLTESQTRVLAPIVAEHGPAAAAAVLSAVVDSGAKPTAAAIRARAEDEGLRPRRTVSDVVVDTETGEIVEDAVRVRVIETPMQPGPIIRPVIVTDDPQTKAAERRRDWLRKLSDGAVHGFLEFDTVTHPNNLDDTVAAWVAFPPVALTSGVITPDMLRATAARITDLAERLLEFSEAS